MKKLILKRERRSGNENSEEEEQARPAFPVSAVPNYRFKDFQSTPPCSAEEYLNAVRHESRRTPKILIADLDSSKNLPVSTPTSYLKLAKEAARGLPRTFSKPGILPAHDWILQTLEDFEFQRELLFERRSLSLSEPPIRTSEELWQGRVISEVPSLSFMASLAQEQVIAFLELNTQWLESQAPTINQLRWLYSALVRLDDVIEADNVALLRTLAKSCIAMRDQINAEDDPLLPALNIIIIIIARFYKQTDLL